MASRMNNSNETLHPQTTELKSNHTVGWLGASEIPRFARQQMRDAQYNTSDTRTNAALATDSWVQFDDAAYDTFQETSTLVQNLIGRGLTHEADFMAEFDYWNTRSTHGKAEVGMHVQATTSDSAVSYGQDGSPIPVIHDDFVVRFREGATEGEELDEDLTTTGVSGASRRVTETVEQLFIGDEDLEFAVNNGQDLVDLHGITTHPEVPTLSPGTDWNTDATTVRDDVRRLRSTIKNDNHVNPGNVGYDLYLGTDYYDVLDDVDPEGSGDMLVRERVDSLANINSIQELDFMDPASALMLRPTEDVIEVGLANDMQTVQWESPFDERFKVLMSAYPRIKVTQEGQVGIAYMEAA